MLFEQLSQRSRWPPKAAVLHKLISLSIDTWCAESELCDSSCVSEYKLVAHKDGLVSFAFNDYKNTPIGEKPKQSICHKPLHNFLDELLHHVPDKRYRMVRYYGLYNSHYRKYLPKQETKNQEVDCNELDWEEFAELRKLDIQNGKPDPLLCPHCNCLMSFDEIIYPFKSYYDDS